MCSAPLRSSCAITIAITVIILRRQGCALVLPFIRATGRSVRVVTVGQGAQVAQAAVDHTAIVAAISNFSER